MKVRPPIRGPKRRSPRQNGGRPACRAAFRPDQPTVGTNFPAMGASADNWRCRRRSRRRRGFLRRRQSRFVKSNSSPRSAVRRRAAPAPRVARRERLRRPSAPSRGFFRAARRRASFAQRRRERAHQPHQPRPSAVAPLRLAVLAPRSADPANRRRFLGPPGRHELRGGTPTPCGRSSPTPKLRWRRPLARAPRR